MNCFNDIETYCTTPELSDTFTCSGAAICILEFLNLWESVSDLYMQQQQQTQ